MFFFDTCNAVAAREDRKPKYWRLGRRHLGLSLTLWRHTVKHDILNNNNNNNNANYLYSANSLKSISALQDFVRFSRFTRFTRVCDCWFPCSCVYWSLVKARKIVWESQVIDSSSITLRKHFEFDAVTSQRQTQSKMAGASRQYFGFRSSRAATALHVSKKKFTFCFNQG